MADYEDSFESQSTSDQSTHDTSAASATAHVSPPPYAAQQVNEGEAKTGAVLSSSVMDESFTEERTRTALEAPSRRAFQELSQFVAFGTDTDVAAHTSPDDVDSSAALQPEADMAQTQDVAQSTRSLGQTSAISTLSQFMQKHTEPERGAPTPAPTFVPALTQLRLPELPVSSLAARPDPNSVALARQTSPLLQCTTAAPAPDVTPPQQPPAPCADDDVRGRREHELRATTEAVERLVRAFATLRGYPALPPTTVPTPEMDVVPAYGTGSIITTAEDDATRRRRRLRALARRPPSCAPSVDDVNERLVEEVVLSCVAEMMATPKPRPTARAVVRADDFGTSAVTGGDAYRVDLSTRRVGRLHEACVLGEDLMHAFASPDPDAHAALHDSVCDALHRYVLRHVIGLVDDPGPTSLAVTPFLAWTLLVDLLSVCLEVIASDALNTAAATSAAAQSRRPVRIGYRGDGAHRAIAVAALHCLPCELLPTANNDDDDVAGRIFQLDYWVTRESMWVVVRAVATTLRTHLLQCAHVLDYDLFALRTRLDAAASWSALTPSTTPFFSLVPATSDDTETLSLASALKRASGRRDAAAPVYFDVHADGLQSLSHAVSRLATELMAQDTPRGDDASAAHEDPTRYDDLTRCTCDTLCELLNDTAVRAAVVRRTREKHAELLRERRERDAARRCKGASERRRADELERLARAEKEVELVVERIRQEMTVRP